MQTTIKSNRLATILFVASFMFSLTALQASHFRYMTVNWEIISTGPSGTVVEFNITQSWRSSFGYPGRDGGASGPVTALNQLKRTGIFSFGDGASTPLVISVNSINTTEDWFVGNATITHTYLGSGNRTAQFSSCCRIAGLGPNSNDRYDMRTVVTLSDPTNASPVANTPPIFYVPINQVSNIQLAAFDPDGDPLSYSYATSSESGLTQPIPNTPNGPASLTASGLLSINTTGLTVGRKFATQVKVSDSRGATIPLDFVIQTVPVSTPPVFVYPPTPANASVINVGQGNTASFNLQATDSDPGSSVNIFATGLPTGATLSGAPGNPSNSSFSWTPTGSDLGAYVIAFTAQDNLFSQAFTSVTINVVPCSIDASATTVDVSCLGGSDGSIDLTLSGNYGNPTFSWTGPNGFMANTEDISGLSAGSYSITATGDFGLGCSVTKTFNVGTTPDVTPPVLLTKDISVSLSGGTASIAPADVLKESEWVGFITAFNLPEYNSGVYEFGVEQLADMKTTVDANAGTLTLQPNFSKYASGDPNYQNGAIGNKFIQASTYVEETELVDQFFTFSGFVQSNTLASGYDNYAFLRLFDQNFGLLYEVRDPLVAGQSFKVVYDFTPANTVYVQYGFGIDGLNANPADEGALGSVVVEAVTTLGDNCGTPSIAISQNSFDCSQIGPNMVNVTTTDNAGNSRSGTAEVNVVGEIPACSIVSAPTSGILTGAGVNTIFLGYGAQSTVLMSTVSGGSSFTYAWAGNTTLIDDASSASPEFTPTAAGSYTFTLSVTNEYGCSSTCDITIDVVDVVCGKNNNKVLVCHNGKTICISPNAVPAHLANHAGDYLGSCTNKANITGNTELNVYPSPSTGLVNLELEILEDADLIIEVMNATGQLVYQETISERAGHHLHSIDLSAVSSGVYMVKVMINGVVEVQRIQIQR